MLDQIVDYEMGELNDDEVISLFSRLIQTGMAWTLQGNCGRTAKLLIDAGYISENGEILNNEE